MHTQTPNAAAPSTSRTYGIHMSISMHIPTRIYIHMHTSTYTSNAHPPSHGLHKKTKIFLGQNQGTDQLSIRHAYTCPLDTKKETLSFSKFCKICTLVQYTYRCVPQIPRKRHFLSQFFVTFVHSCNIPIDVCSRYQQKDYFFPTPLVTFHTQPKRPFLDKITI